MDRYWLLSFASRSVRPLLFALTVLALTFTSIPLPVVGAAAGDLDPTFGNGGLVKAGFPGGLTIGGTGTLTKRGSQITLQHNAADRRVMASIDTSTKRATASIQLLSQGRTFSITDRNITNNTCACK